LNLVLVAIRGTKEESLKTSGFLLAQAGAQYGPVAQVVVFFLPLGYVACTGIVNRLDP